MVLASLHSFFECFTCVFSSVCCGFTHPWSKRQEFKCDFCQTTCSWEYI